MSGVLNKRQIGSTNVYVTELGMGGAPLGKVSQHDANVTLRESFSQGIRYFDTAPLYGAGTSEKFFGQFLSTLTREDFILSTKVGRLIRQTGDEIQITFDYKRDDILLIRKIRILLYERGLTISGAKKNLSSLNEDSIGSLKEEILEDLEELHNVLKKVVK